MPLRGGMALRAALAECLRKAQGARGGREDFDAVRLCLDAPTVLVPAALFDPAQAEDYLAINNLKGGETVYAEAGDGIVAVMAAPREALDTFRGVFGNRLTVGSAFGVALERKETTMYLTGSRAYIAVWDAERLVFCDSLPYSAAADLVYYAVQLLPPRARIRIKGLGARAAAQPLCKKFRVKCE